MKFIENSLNVMLMISAVYLVPAFSTNLVNAEEVTAQKESIRVPAMRNRVYTQLARAQSIADAGDKNAGLAVLDAVYERIDSLNSYEKAMLFNFYGFMHYAAEDTVNAVRYFEKVVAEKAIPETLRVSTLFSLAQLSMQQQNYDETLAYLNRWQNVNSKPLSAQQYVFFAQVHYQRKHFEKSLTAIENAIEVTRAEKNSPKENWLILQRANYYELKQPENVTKVLEQLVRLFPKPEYWVQLAGMYGEIEEEDKQMAVMEAAWQAGFVTKAQDIITLAQLYRFHGAPYKAAQVLENAIAEGAIVAKERYLAMLAQAYTAAKNDEKAIPVLIKASEIAETGKYDVQLAQAYLNLEQWSNAINSADKALERGISQRVGDMHLVQGMAYYNLQKFDQSLTALKMAEALAGSEKMAKQWYKFVVKEQGYHTQLAMIN